MAGSMTNPGAKQAAAVIALALAGCAFRPAGGAGGDADDAGTGDDAGEADAADDDGSDARPDASLPSCPIGYASIGNSTTQYRVVEDDVIWGIAAFDCNDDDDDLTGGGHTHLVVVGDDLEKAALTGQFSGNTWVGLTDELVEGTFVWVTAEPTGGYPVVGQRPPWDSGDPDGAIDENCVRFKNSFDFEDKSCFDLNSYVCECDRFAPN
jgi:hypothetical protein